MSKADRLVVIRLLLNALQPAEIDATRRAYEHRHAAEKAEKKKARVEATKEDVGRGLAKAFGGNSTDSSAPDLWARDAKAAAQAEEFKADPELEQKLKKAREAVTDKDGEIRRAENRLSGIEGELAGLVGQLKTLSEVLPKKELLFQDVANPKCPECGQPIPAHAETFIAERKAERDVLVKRRDEAREGRAH